MGVGVGVGDSLGIPWRQIRIGKDHFDWSDIGHTSRQSLILDNFDRSDIGHFETISDHSHLAEVDPERCPFVPGSRCLCEK